MNVQSLQVKTSHIKEEFRRVLMTWVGYYNFLLPSFFFIWVGLSHVGYNL